MRRSGGLQRVLIALVPAWMGWAATQALIGWLVFAATKSPLLVGLAFAVRFGPLALAGVPAGALSDRFGRVPVLQCSNAVAVAISFAIVALTFLGSTPLIVLLIASAGFGLADAGRMVSSTNLVYDLASGIGPTRAIAASNFVAGIGTSLGATLAGFTLSATIPAVTAAVVGLGYASSAVLLINVSEQPARRSKATSSFASRVVQGLALLREVPAVGVLIAMALFVEVFAFSSVALDPVFAGQVFMAGPAGLGLILAARAVGRLTGSGVLTIVKPRQSIGRTVAVAIFGFGIALAAYSRAPGLVVGVPLVFGAGAAGVVLDSLVSTALQAGVAPTSRGRVAGLWVLMIGLQPIGVIEIAVLAQFTDARFAQLANGVVVAAFGMIILGTAAGKHITEIQANQSD